MLPRGFLIKGKYPTKEKAAEELSGGYSEIVLAPTRRESFDTIEDLSLSNHRCEHVR